jgi:carboxyl-terminal processing protease
LLTVNDGKVNHRIGVITLPSFYRDFDAQQRGDASVKSASNDVAHLLSDLKTQGAEGVVIDLRDNGGGSLTEAVRLTGLFTGKGPVLQERHSDGQLVVDSNTDVGTAWTGPVGVLINRNSASASEIFAAAIQDYGRGIVIGERSFGKGTVQSTVSLDALVDHAPAELGELKMTTAQFFRIDGGTTQLRGVIPDIDFSTAVYDRPWGEGKFDNALPSFKVKPADFIQQKAVKELAPELAQRSAERIAVNPAFQDLRQQAIRVAQRQKANVISLNEEERRKERNSVLASLSPDPLAGAGHRSGPAGSGATLGIAADDGLDPSERADPPAAAAKTTPKDVVLDEAAHVVSDEATLLRTASSSAVKPASPTARAAISKAGKGAHAAGF